MTVFQIYTIFIIHTSNKILIDLSHIFHCFFTLDMSLISRYIIYDTHLIFFKNIHLGKLGKVIVFLQLLQEL